MVRRPVASWRRVVLAAREPSCLTESNEYASSTKITSRPASSKSAMVTPARAKPPLYDNGIPMRIGDHHPIRSSPRHPGPGDCWLDVLYSLIITAEKGRRNHAHEHRRLREAGARYVGRTQTQAR